MLKLPNELLNLIIEECDFGCLGRLSQTCTLLNEKVQDAPFWKKELIRNKIIPNDRPAKQQVLEFYEKYSPLVRLEILVDAPKSVIEARSYLSGNVELIHKVLLQRIKNVNREGKPFSKVEESALHLLVKEGYPFSDLICMLNLKEYSSIKNLITFAIEKRFSYETVETLVKKNYLVNSLTVEKALELSDEKTINLLIDHLTIIDSSEVKNLIRNAYRSKCSYIVLEKLHRFLKLV